MSNTPICFHQRDSPDCRLCDCPCETCVAARRVAAGLNCTRCYGAEGVCAETQVCQECEEDDMRCENCGNPYCCGMCRREEEDEEDRYGGYPSEEEGPEPCDCGACEEHDGREGYDSDDDRGGW